MMCCSACPFNRANYAAVPEAALGAGPWGEVFFCRSPRCPRPAAGPDEAFRDRCCHDCPHRTARSLCRQDAYVLATIAEEDEFALETVHHTLDTLVEDRQGHYLGELFRCAPAEIRRDLWTRLTACHSGALHLMNEVFEQAELAPLEPGEWPEDIRPYRSAAEGNPPIRRPVDLHPWGEFVSQAVPLSPAMTMTPAVPLAPIRPMPQAVPLAPVVTMTPAVPLASIVPMAPAFPVTSVGPMAPEPAPSCRATELQPA
ncbi:MAG: hypothetical protein GX442_10490 [Candidatus Riflebacteria bacterium]|nr:hypothetical protein [Candidatus Riflebacteria bacterium]